MSYCVYKHTAPNGKVYIGITCKNPIIRWRNGHGYKHNQHFTNAIQKFGWNKFKHEILFTDLSKEEAEQKEIELIALYKSNNREYGYNIENGGNHNGKHSAETLRKMSEAQKGKPKPYVPHYIDIEKLRRINLGNKYSLGVKRTEWHKNRLRELKSKQVFQYTLSGELIAVYTSLANAEKATGISKGNICMHIQGKRTHAGGFIWRYTDE